MQYCLPVGQFVKNETMSVQFSSVTSLCTRLTTGKGADRQLLVVSGRSTVADDPNYDLRLPAQRQDGQRLPRLPAHFGRDLEVRGQLRGHAV